MNPQPPSGKDEPSAPAVNLQLGAGLSAESLQAQLEKILSSKTFGSTQRLSRFLRYTVEQTLQGRRDQIKEYRLGLEVFDRNQSYDPRIDPIVRVEAGRLRSRLQAYYDEEGRDDPVLISYPKGSYVPLFQRRESSVATLRTNRSWISFLRERKIIPLYIVLAMAGATVFWWAHRARTNSYPQREQGLHGPLASVAVLPFESLSADPEQGHFADGMTEALLAELTKVRALRVISRTSTMHYKGTRQPLREIARELNTNLIVTGSVTPSGQRVRIIVHLMDAAQDSKLWAESYERDLGDTLALQSEVARAVADQIRLKLASPEQVR